MLLNSQQLAKVLSESGEEHFWILTSCRQQFNSATTHKKWYCWIIFCWCLVEILKMKCDQDLCLNLWYDFKKLLWQDELNPRVRCAFGNVSFQSFQIQRMRLLLLILPSLTLGLYWLGSIKFLNNTIWVLNSPTTCLWLLLSEIVFQGQTWVI